MEGWHYVLITLALPGYKSPHVLVYYACCLCDPYDQLAQSRVDMICRNPCHLKSKIHCLLALGNFSHIGD